MAGEESGDMYAAGLIKSLLALNSGIRVEGIGGERMREAGGRTLYDISEMSSVGVSAMLGRASFFLNVMKDIKNRIADNNYDAVILIDYPDFNLRIAKAADLAGVPVFYYVCPQLWAWRRYRIKTVRKHVDMMIVALPFEEEFYIKRGVNARFLGHPILDEYNPPQDKAKLREKFGADPSDTLLGLWPGSRSGEVARLLPIMLDAVKIIREEKPVKLIVSCAESVDHDTAQKIINDKNEEATIVKGGSFEAMSALDFLLCKSGTSTLQAAIAGTPMVIVYKSDLFSYLLAKSLVYIKWAGLPNLLAGREIVPELLQWRATPRAIAKTALAYLADSAKREEMRMEFKSIVATLGQPGAPLRAAQLITEYLRKVKNG